MTREDRETLLGILHAHAQTVAICEVCASTTRDLAAEVARGSTPRREDLHQTIEEAERVLSELSGVRTEVERLIAGLARG